MIRRIIPTFIMIVFAVGFAHADTFGEAKSKSLFTDIKAHTVGDLLTVLIVEDARASNKAKVTTKKKSRAETSGGPGIGGIDFFAQWGMSGENSNEFDGEGRLEKNGSIRAKIAVRVISVYENGDLAVEGSRVMSINADKETLFLSGIVRQKDISSENTIYSFQVADAQISFKGKGQTHDGARPGFFSRLINWIF
ncbi:MAG: flagellar basal body L-ring protein FlgH [candidate division Zixibacteria bacterium]